MKKNVVIVVLSAFVLVALAWYFIPLPSPTARKLQVYSVEIFTPQMNLVFKELCHKWAEQHHVELSVETIPLKDLDVKLTQLVQNQSGDLATFYAHKIPIYKDKLLDLTDLAKELGELNNGYYSIATDMTRIDGRYHAVPAFAWSHVWVFNGDLLKQAGVRPPKTFSEARELAIQLKKRFPTIRPFGIGLGRDDDAAMFLQAVLWAHGGRVVAEDGRRITINSKETRRAVEYVVRLYQDDKVIPEGAFGWDGGANNKAFLAKTIAFTMNSPSILVTAKEQDPALANDILHSMYPAGPSGERYSYGTGFAFAAPKNTEKRQLIESLLRYLYQPDNYKKLIEAGGGAVNPWLRSAANLPMWADPRLKAGLDSLDIERPVGWPGPVTAAAAEVFDRRILAGIISDVVQNGMSIDEAVVKAENEIRRIYESVTSTP